jgi:HAD superfamily hydrolase (TIGR01509 family)
MPRPAAILLDLDGTTVDSEPLHCEAHRRFLATKGVPITDAELVGNIGKGDQTFYAALMKERGITADAKAWVEHKTDTLIDLYHEGRLTLRPGVQSLLDRARHAGIACCVVTSADRRLAVAALEVTGLAARLPMRVCFEDVARHKPDPQPYLLSASRLAVSPRRCLAVEDSISGVKAARAAGCRVLAFRGLVADAALRAAGANELVDTLDGIDWDLA